MLPGHVFGRTGAGDVKLLAAGGTLLGPAATVTAFLVMAVAGGVIALVIAVRSRRVRGVEFAYAPAVAVGITLAALAG
jgi:prepilin peptidase CpaA